MSIKVVNNYKPLCVNEHQCLSYRKGKLYVHSKITDKPIFFGSLPMTKKQKLLSVLRLTERIMRLEPRTALQIDRDQYLLSDSGALYFIDVENKTIMCEHQFREGMKNPLNICKIEGIEGFDDCIAYGEYWGNPNRDEVSIYTRKNKQWVKKYSFPKGTVRHIHGIIVDKYRQGVLILTGDRDSESAIWMAKNDFQEVEPILQGSQLYRICVAFPLEEGILFAMDSAHSHNVIALAISESNVWKTKTLFEMPGACIYGTKNDDRFIFATSVESSCKYGRIRNLFSYELGKGVKDRKSYVIAGNLDLGFQEIIAFNKDFLPMGLCQFGNVQFPGGEIKGNIVMYPISVCKYDGHTVLYQLYS